MYCDEQEEAILAERRANGGDPAKRRSMPESIASQESVDGRYSSVERNLNSSSSQTKPFVIDSDEEEDGRDGQR